MLKRLALLSALLLPLPAAAQSIMNPTFPGGGSIGPSTPTTFTAGSVIFSNGTTLAQDNANFNYTAGGHLGLGTTASASFGLLNVSGPAGFGSATSIVSIAGLANQGMQLVSTGGGAKSYIARFSNDPGTPALYFGKSRGTTAAAGAVVSGDPLGSFTFAGDDGSTNGAIPITGAQVTASVDGTVSTGIVPARITWSTMNAAGVLAERVRLSASGGFSIGSTSDAGATNLLVAGTIRSNTGFNINGTAGASCTLTIVAHLTVVSGVVTLCN